MVADNKLDQSYPEMSIYWINRTYDKSTCHHRAPPAAGLMGGDSKILDF